MNIIVAGIHTGIGKTICSAVLCQALGYDYWKPVQAGDLENSDTVFIKNHVTNPSTKTHEEKYKLLTAASPHYAAELEGIKIERGKFIMPISENSILTETAGGLMSPLANDFLNIDLIEYLGFPVVLVSGNYLGSINHTLLSCAALQQRKIPVKGIVFSGEKVPASEKYILDYSGLPLLFSIPHFEKISPSVISDFAADIPVNIFQN